jgi:hypothetical protein
MASPEEALSDQVSGTLDEAVACLSEADRQAIVLRFYEGKSLAEVGLSMGTTEEAAKKRVARAVKKLRGHFERRGLVIPLALLMLLLAGRSHAAGAIPEIVAPAAAPPVAHSIAEGALRLMTHAQAKLLGAIFAGGLALLLGIWAAIPVAPPPPATVAQAPAAPRATIRIPTTRPADPERQPEPAPRFADMWIGYKGQLLWRSDTYADPDPVPFVLKSGPRFERPYAVAVDPTGNYYIRPLDQAILEYPAVQLAHTDYDPIPVAPHERVSTMLSLIADGAPAGFSILPDPARGLLEEQNWHRLRRSQDEEGTVVVEPPSPMRFSPLNFGAGGLGDGGALTETISVPEPALLGLLALAPLLLRRRRVAKNRDIP